MIFRLKRAYMQTYKELQDARTYINSDYDLEECEMYIWLLNLLITTKYYKES